MNPRQQITPPHTELITRKTASEHIAELATEGAISALMVGLTLPFIAIILDRISQSSRLSNPVSPKNLTELTKWVLGYASLILVVGPGLGASLGAISGALETISGPEEECEDDDPRFPEPLSLEKIMHTLKPFLLLFVGSKDELGDSADKRKKYKGYIALSLFGEIGKNIFIKCPKLNDKNDIQQPTQQRKRI